MILSTLFFFLGLLVAFVAVVCFAYLELKKAKRAGEARKAERRAMDYEYLSRQREGSAEELSGGSSQLFSAPRLSAPRYKSKKKKVDGASSSAPLLDESPYYLGAPSASHHGGPSYPVPGFEGGGGSFGGGGASGSWGSNSSGSSDSGGGSSGGGE